jgi:hypothetical protein
MLKAYSCSTPSLKKVDSLQYSCRSCMFAAEFQKDGPQSPQYPTRTHSLQGVSGTYGHGIVGSSSST